MTTDAERARRFVQPSYLLPPEHPEVAALAAEFARVRADERAQIVAWLRGRATSFNIGTGREQRTAGSVYVASVLGEADLIARGAHHEETT